MALRDLFIGVDFDVNERSLRAGDNALNSLTQETNRAGTGMKKLDKNSKSAGNSIKKIGKNLGTFIGVYELGKGLKFSLEQASMLAEETDKFNTVFGEMSQQAGVWATEYSKKVNSSVVETRSAIAENQNLLVGFGASREEAFKMATSMRELSDDLSAMNNIEKEITSNNLQSVMLGQHQAGKKLGLAITEAGLKQLALNKGYTESFDTLDPLVKMQLRFDLALQQSQDSIGKAESEAHTFAGSMRGLKATLLDTSAVAGEKLMPVIGDMIGYFNDNKDAIVDMVVNGVGVASRGIQVLFETTKLLIGSYEKVEPLIWGLAVAWGAQKVLLGASGLIGLIGKLNSMQLVLGTSTKISTALEWAWITATNALGASATATTGVMGTLNAVMSANPIGVMVIAIGSAVVGLKLLYKHSEKFRQFWDKWITPIWDKLKAFIGIAGTSTKVQMNSENRNINETVVPKYNSIALTSDMTKEERAQAIITGSYATGTNNAKPGLAKVGERGTEIVAMNGGEKVFTHNETRNIIGDLGGNKRQNSINIDNNTTRRGIIDRDAESSTESIFNDMSKKNINEKSTINTSNNVVNIEINTNTTQSALEIARETRREIENYFKEARLKGGFAIV